MTETLPTTDVEKADRIELLRLVEGVYRHTDMIFAKEQAVEDDFLIAIHNFCGMVLTACQQDDAELDAELKDVIIAGMYKIAKEFSGKASKAQGFSTHTEAAQVLKSAGGRAHLH